MIYHEKQISFLCGMHALNSCFQREEFTKDELSSIATELSSHKSLFDKISDKFGVFDINVIMIALNKRGYEIIWHDNRKPLDFRLIESCFGIIINITTQKFSRYFNFFSLPYSRRHWFTIKKINNSYYNLDSILNSPENLGSNIEKICLILDEIIKTREAQVMFVCKTC